MTEPTNDSGLPPGFHTIIRRVNFEEDQPQDGPELDGPLRGDHFDPRARETALGIASAVNLLLRDEEGNWNLSQEAYEVIYYAIYEKIYSGWRWSWDLRNVQIERAPLFRVGDPFQAADANVISSAQIQITYSPNGEGPYIQDFDLRVIPADGTVTVPPPQVTPGAQQPRQEQNLSPLDTFMRDFFSRS